MSKVIAVDFDSTIINSCAVVYNLWAKDNGVEEPYSPNHGWNFEGLLPEGEGVKALKYFVDKRFYSEEFMEAYPMACETLNLFVKQGYKVIIVSRQCEERRPNTLEWVGKTMPGVEVEFTTSFDKSAFKGFLFIDDRMDALESSKGNYDHIYCYGSYEWNKDWKGDRFNNWEEVREFVLHTSSV